MEKKNEVGHGDPDFYAHQYPTTHQQQTPQEVLYQYKSRG